MSAARGTRAAVWAALVAATVVGCQLIGGIEQIRATGDPEGGSDGTADDGSQDALASDVLQDASTQDASGDGRDGDGAETGASGPVPSCVGLAATCGGTKDCCASNLVTGTAGAVPFYRSNDPSYPATVNDFKLDVYEVTVGRFRAFVDAGKGTQASPPAAGDGAHPKVAGSGWDPSFNGNLTAATFALKAALKCNPSYPAWTDAPSGNETKPMNCVTWFEAFAFCAWDGGRLPTEAEWNYAAAGGTEQRDYPGGTGIDSTKASYDCTGDGSVSGECAFSDFLPVGSRSPQGDGKWGQAGLAGNVWEWSLDGYAPYRTDCNNCANTQAASYRMIRGGSFYNSLSLLLSSSRNNFAPTIHSNDIGVRCARTGA